jgi:hypothetical protein
LNNVTARLHAMRIRREPQLYLNRFMPNEFFSAVGFADEIVMMFPRKLEV